MIILSLLRDARTYVAGPECGPSRRRARPHRGRRRPHRAARQRRAGVGARRDRGRTPTAGRGVRVHQMHALHDRPYLHGTMRDHLLHVSYFLSPVTRPAFHERGCELVPNHFSEVPRLLRETHEVLARARRRRADGPARLLLAGHQLRLRRRRSSGRCRSSSRSTSGCRAPSARNQVHVQPGRRLDRGRSAARRGPRRAARRTSTSASPRTSPSASPTARRSRPASAPSRTRCSRACATTATSACTPSCSPTGSSTSSSAAS